MAASKEPLKNNYKRKPLSKDKVIKKPSKYDEKIVVNATFEELVKALVTPKQK